MKLTIPACITSIVLFLMLEVFWASEIKGYLTQLDALGDYVGTTVILYIGIISIFFISLGVMIVINSASDIRFKKLGIFLLIFISFIVSIIGFNFFIFIQLNIAYPMLFGNLPFIQKLGLLYLYFTYYAIYFLSSPVYLWFIFIIIDFALLSIMMKYVLQIKNVWETTTPKSNKSKLLRKIKRKKKSKSGEYKIPRKY